MKKYIEREALLTFANNHKNGEIDCNDIARFPAADVVEVVRCKDCKHWGNGDCYRLELSRPDDFCSCGERKEEYEPD